MARPPKNAQGPSATERMELAFWDCLKTMSYDEITVRDIVDRAKVNRNSYYYHYDSMWDLAKGAIQHTSLASFARAVLDGTDETVTEAEASSAFEHLSVLAGENGNQRLIDDARQIVVTEWLSLHELELDTISGSLKQTIDFVFGGIVALLASNDTSDLGVLLNRGENSGVVGKNLEMLEEELNNANPRTKEQVNEVLAPEEEVEEKPIRGRFAIDRESESIVVSEDREHDLVSIEITKTKEELVAVEEVSDGEILISEDTEITEREVSEMVIGEIREVFEQEPADIRDYRPSESSENSEGFEEEPEDNFGDSEESEIEDSFGPELLEDIDSIDEPDQEYKGEPVEDHGWYVIRQPFFMSQQEQEPADDMEEIVLDSQDDSPAENEPLEIERNSEAVFEEPIGVKPAFEYQSSQASETEAMERDENTSQEDAVIAKAETPERKPTRRKSKPSKKQEAPEAVDEPAAEEDASQLTLDFGF